MKNFVLAVDGTSCAGKSTLIDNFCAQHTNLLHIDPDKIKWFFHDYLEKKDYYRPIIGGLVLSMIQEAIDHGVNVIYDARESIDIHSLDGVMKEKGYEFSHIYVEAEFSILLDRFRERIENVKAEGRVIGNMDEGVFEKMYESYRDRRSQEGSPFILDSGKLSETEMLEQLKEHIYS